MHSHMHMYIHIYVYVYYMYIYIYTDIKQILAYFFIYNTWYIIQNIHISVSYQYSINLKIVGNSWPLWHPQDHVQTWSLFKFCHNLSSSLKFATLAKLCETCSVQGTTWASKLSQWGSEKCIWIYLIWYFDIFWIILDILGWTSKARLLEQACKLLSPGLDRAGRTDHKWPQAVKVGRSKSSNTFDTVVR